MAPESVTHTQGKFLAALGPLALALLLLIYGAGMLALPVYFFGLEAGLWLSAALLAGGISLLVVLASTNRTPVAAPKPLTTSCALAATQPPRTWVRPRTIPFQ